MDSSALGVLLWTLFLCTARPVESFSSGPPHSSCMAMYPHHSEHDSRVTSSPFTVSFSPADYNPGDAITVTIASESAGDMLRGVIFQARRPLVNNEEIVGIFQDLVPATKLQFMSCQDSPNNTVGHSNPDDVPSVQATWVADQNYGPVVFYATVLQSYSHFYANVQSNVLKPINDATVVPPPILASTTANKEVNIDWGACGSSKGCLLYPGYCTDTDCIAAVSFAVNSADNTVTFEMMAKVVGYVSLGFSDDKIMGDDQTITCTADHEVVNIQNGYNADEKYNVRILGTNLTKLEAYASRDDYLYCRFTRPMAMHVAGMKTFDLRDDYYLFIAWGPTYSLSDSLKIHIELPVISNSKITFTDSSTYRGSVMPTLIRAHSSLMTICWMAFAALAIVMPRYYKQGFDGRKLFGKPIWFQLHRAASVMTLLLTVIGLILVLVLLEGEITEKESAYNHMVLGFTVVALIIAQVIAGLLRPDPTSSIRPLFNFFHRLMGVAAVVIAAACIIYAYKIREFSYAMQEFGEKTMAVWISVFVILNLVLTGYEYFATECSARRHDANTYNMDKDDDEPEQKKPTTPSYILFFIFLLFIVCSFIAALLMTVLF